MKEIFNEIKLLFYSKAFVISVLLLITYMAFFGNFYIFNKMNVEHIYYFFLALLPLVVSVFAILISFTDGEFLKFLKGIKVDEKTENSVYDSIITYFTINTLLIFFSLILFCVVLSLELTGIMLLQYVMLFTFTYSLVSFVQLVRFIFYFAKKKAEFVDLDTKRTHPNQVHPPVSSKI
jgi:hypothetical protein